MWLSNGGKVSQRTSLNLAGYISMIHTPWEPPSNWEGDPYRGEISKVDHLLSGLLTLADDAWVIVTSDHGEGLWEHGEREHGVLLGRGVTRVPLIIRPPGGANGEMSLPQPEVVLNIERPDGVDDLLVGTHYWGDSGGKDSGDASIFYRFSPDDCR